MELSCFQLVADADGGRAAWPRHQQGRPAAHGVRPAVLSPDVDRAPKVDLAGAAGLRAWASRRSLRRTRATRLMCGGRIWTWKRSRKTRRSRIPDDFDYTTLASLKAELRQKLELHRPSTLAQAARIEGMTPAALMLLLASVKKLSQGRGAAETGFLMSGATRISGPKEFAEAFDVSRETLARLETYEGLVQSLAEGCQPYFSLDAGRNLAPALRRSRATSASCARFSANLAGSRLGGRIPGLVLAILLAGREGAKMTLVESDARKAAFLGEVARKTGAPVEIYSDRIEKLATQAKSLQRDVITARALAPLPRLLELVAPFFLRAPWRCCPKERRRS